MKKVMVLMSTYNGEKFLREQIESILNQKNVNIKILVRDDGSTDETIAILKEYQNKGLLKFYSGENLKPAKSFLDLLKNSDSADYYSFADQDDFWMEDKLFRAIEMLEKSKNTNGRLYFSATNVVDENLNFIYKNEVKDFINFSSAMIKNQATGCTMVIDQKMRNIINKCEFDFISMHDACIYRIGLARNSFVCYDNNSYIKYRQHGNNVLGMTNNFFKLWKNRLNRFFYSSFETSNTAKEILKNFDDLDKEKQETLLYLSEYKTNIKYKIKLLFSNKCRSKSLIVNLLFKVKILFNKA